MIAKSWDNRYGCTVVLEALRELKNEALPNTLIAGANVQEEVGLRGTGPSVTKFNPDLFFAVDCSAADDLTGSKDTFGHLDQGFLLRILDPGLITLPRMKEFFRRYCFNSQYSIPIFCFSRGNRCRESTLNESRGS